MHSYIHVLIHLNLYVYLLINHVHAIFDLFDFFFYNFASFLLFVCVFNFILPSKAWEWRVSLFSELNRTNDKQTSIWTHSHIHMYMHVCSQKHKCTKCIDCVLPKSCKFKKVFKCVAESLKWAKFWGHWKVKCSKKNWFL